MAGTLEERLKLMEDIQEILQLKAAYWNACDGGWGRPTHDYDQVASLFVEDGVWESSRSGPIRGREAIREYFKKLREEVAFAIHCGSNPVVHVNGDRATGNWHAVINIGNPPKGGWTLGIYDDEYVRTSAGWRIKSMRFTRAGNMPYDNLAPGQKLS